MNSREFKAQMERKNKSSKQLYKALKISRSAWYRKLNGISSFTQPEICILRHELELDDGLTMTIFFDEKVS